MKGNKPSETKPTVYQPLSFYVFFKSLVEGFPGGAVVKNSPANAGDMGSSPGLGRSPVLWSN